MGRDDAVIRFLSPLPPRPGGNMWPSRLSALWTPADLGSVLIYEALAENATLSGSNITALANPHGTAGAMVTGATSCTRDASVLLNGNAAIATSSTSSDLHVATGGPTGNGAFAVYALMQITAQKSAGGDQDSNVITLGNPGNDGTHKQYGIGVNVAANGPYMRVGGFGNTALVGATNNLPMVWDGKLRLFELNSSGSLVTFSADGGLLASLATAVTLDTSGAIGFRGAYPLPAYGPPPALVYGMWVCSRALTSTERANLLAYASRKFAYTPARFFSTTGDSKTAGHITGFNPNDSSNAINTTSYGELMVSQYASAGSTIYYKNDGITSQTTAQIRARVETAGFFNSFAPSAFRRQYMVIRGYTNDPGAGLTPAQSYANIAAISVLAQSYGIKTIVSTEYGTTAYNQGNRDNLATFNGLVIANSCGANAIGDIRGNVSGGTTANPTTVQLPDGTHPSDATNALDAAVYVAAANSIP